MKIQSRCLSPLSCLATGQAPALTAGKWHFSLAAFCLPVILILMFSAASWAQYNETVIYNLP